ncbi:cupin domain-containing protein [Paenibacillus sp. UNC451MF]|uniref:cupin domain-containing protein n=1 Tax=Paenibacillus sp. UNC451MF TaxID=1449063 RepID=UPI00048F410B|nr:AraC family ligand binding domain-containing protein [Paenibacillus sp. UNC451MF]
MKKYRLSDLQDTKEGHFLQGILPGEYLSSGGLAFEKPGYRTHSNDGPEGRDYHVHKDCEVFIIAQGKGEMEVDKTFHPVVTGDIFVIEPGEDHHLISSKEDPIVTLWVHAGPARHKNQLEEQQG